MEADVDMADTAHMLASLAQRSLRPCRIALTIAVSACTAAEREEAVARMESALRLQGLLTTVPSLPGFLPFTAAAPAGVPLRRSIHMTTDAVASCMLPALATPLDDCRHPLLGLAEATEAPAYLSVWECPNHNAIVLGTSGSGKSVAVKTMLARHVMSGAAAVVLDPDSEYRRLMAALGGTHIELGADALNPLGPGTALAPDEAAGLVLPVLSLMSGDERGVRDGRPIRRLPDEDQGWLYDQLADFYRSWGGTNPRVEPVLSDLLSHMRRCSDAAGHSDQQRERARVIRARLARYVQGDRSSLFDRRSTFSVGERPTAIGFRSVAMAYASDLTPALAVVLSALLARLRNGASRLLVVVDEAHRVTSDPDAGEVLGQLVRQARKYGAGVWMCSQRIDDFVATDLGRTLASTAATKLVMGVEEAALSDVRAVFSLRDEEVAAVHPALPGRGVLISGGQRCVVRILPGAAVLAVASSSPVFAALH